MDQSILEKVIELKHQQDQASVTASELINQLLSSLDDKEADIIRRRHAFTKDRKETLEQIGREYDVTRERIRQLEKQAIQKLQSAPDYAETIKPAESAVVHVMEQHGSVMQDQMLYDYFLGDDHDPNDPERRYWSFLMTYIFHRSMTQLPKGSHYERGWRLHDARLDFVDTMIVALTELLGTIGTPQPFDEVYQALQQQDIYQQHGEKLKEPVVLSLLHVAAPLHKNPYHEYGLREWGHVQPKRMHDRIYLVLKKHGQPMHFEEIAKEITAVFARRAYPPTVHNELILNDEYVLVGRGLYALREWGYREGIVSDIVADVLAKASRPMTRDEVVDEVLKQRQVKRNTILLALTQKDRFEKCEDGRYQVHSVTPASTESEAQATTIS